jgi:glycosyltransferase involved in cell wall biosynthesis
MQPLVSIVIANYNYGRFLETAISSVLRQCDDAMRLPSGERIELIIVDGGSADNSVEIIKKYESKLTWWCSEKDRGQSHAFNKGFSKASGKFLTWLNADDLLCLGALEELARRHRRFPDCEWFTGNFFRFGDNGRICEVNWGPHVYPKILQRWNSPIVVFGPTSFFSKNIYEKVGKVDESLNYMMDTDLWLKFMAADVMQVRINHYCWAFRLHVDSKTSEFGNHILDQKTKERFCAESDRVMAARKYKMSAVLYYLLLGIRLIDGSLARGAYLKWQLQNRALTCLLDNNR